MFRIEQSYNSWNLERISRHVLYWLFWLLFYTAVNGTNHNEYVPWFFVELCVMPVKLLVTYSVIYILVPRFLIKGKYLSFVFWTLILSILGGIGTRCVEYYYLADAFDFGFYKGEFYNHKFVYRILDLVYTASLPTVIKLLQRSRRVERANTQLTSERMGAELQLLKNQLQPHFLFNTLNNLYGMVLTQSKNAPDVVLGLSNLLSYMLYETQSDWVPLQKEVDQLERYLALEQIRYDERLDISFFKNGTLDQHQIAPMLLFPFMENAIKHSAAATEEPSWVKGSISVDDEYIVFRLENSVPIRTTANGNGLHSGIGLQNVRKRLELIYPDCYELDIQSGDTFLVHLQIKHNEPQTLHYS